MKKHEEEVTFTTMVTNPKQRRSLLASMAFAVAAGIVFAAVLWMMTPPAKAANQSTGSGPSARLCIDARHDRGPAHPHPEINTVKTDCRMHGWIVRPRIVVGPHGHVRFRTMPLCINEDGSYLKPGYPVYVGPRSVGLQRHCFWNAHSEGNGRGSSYILDHVHGGTRITYTEAG